MRPARAPAWVIVMVVGRAAAGPRFPSGDPFVQVLTGAGEGIRTPDRLITNQLLYRAELRQPDKVASLARRPTASKSDSKSRDDPAATIRGRHDRTPRQIHPTDPPDRPEPPSIGPDLPAGQRRRCRTASKSTIAVATETFRLDTRPAIGMAAT